MSDDPPKTKPAVGTSAGTAPAGGPRQGPAADWSPRFRSLEEVEKALIRLQQAGVELDLGLLSRVEDLLKSLRPLTDPALSVAWLDRAEPLLRELCDKLDGLKEDHAEKLTELNPAQYQAELAKTEAQARGELNALKGARFRAEKQVWQERIDKNLAALRLKQESQAEKLQTTVTAEEGRIVVRPSDEFWAAYTAWLVQVHEILRDFLGRLLRDRWGRFIEEHVASVAKPLDANFAIELPVVPLDDLPNPVLVAAAYPTPIHYRDNGLSGTEGKREADVKAPEEVVHAHELDRASGSSHGSKAVLDTLRAALPMLGAVTVGTATPAGHLGVKVLIGIAGVGVTTVLAVTGFKKQREVRRLVETERVEKATESLKRKLVDDFRRRLDRHRMDVETFVRDYNANVQQAIFQRLSALVDGELAHRSSLLPQQRAELQGRKQKLSARVQVLDGASRMMASVLVELEVRRRVLRDEIARRLSGDGQ